MKGKRIVAFAMILGIAMAIGSPLGNISVQSPEETSGASPPRPGCTSDSECPDAVGSPDQTATCLAPRCDKQTGLCGTTILTGKRIPSVLVPSGAECFLHPLVCSDTGSAIADTSQKVPLVDGETCSSPTEGQRVCHKPVCMSGSCINVVNTAVTGQECGPSKDDRCITETPLCNGRGECVPGASKRLLAGAQCAPPGQLPTGVALGKPEFLPASFIQLFSQGGKPPEYSCGDDCKLQYCGDGIRNRREEACDGSDLPPNAPKGSSCLPNCTLTGGQSCEPQSDKPVVCRLDAATESGIEERVTFSIEDCRYIVAVKSVARPKSSCSERTFGKDAVITRAMAFVPTDDKQGCRWVLEESAITAPSIECSMDSTTGNGIERRPEFSVERCEYTLNSTKFKKPEPRCSEVEKGKSAIVLTPVAFVRAGDTCEWKQEEKTITAQPKSCRFDEATGKAFEDRSVLSASCEYVAQSQEIPKPAPECIDSGFNDLIFTQVTTFNAKSGVCEWNTDKVRIKKPSTDGCTVLGNTGTLVTNTLVSDMQAVPPVCRWEQSTTVLHAPLDTCEYRDGISTPPYEDLQYLSDSELKDLMERLGKLTFTDHSINPQSCTVSTVVDERYYPEITSCANNVVSTTWIAHDTLFPFLSGKRVEPCSWISRQEACQGPPFRDPPLRNGGGSTAPPPSQPKPPPAQPPPPPPAPPAQCNYYTVSASLFNGVQQGLSYTAGSQRSCIASRLSWAQGQCAKSNQWGSGPEYLDDCIANNMAPAGSVLLDAKCQAISAMPTGAILCSSAVYGYRASPISLVWGNKDTSTEISVSEFPLFADASKKVVVWKASDSKPLLVLDSDHTGKVSSRQQLFGEHFRGGNKGKSWIDGYEALGSLDANSDGEVSGDELKPLALWFDANRDGISQTGEVRPLSHPEVDVRKLFYKGGIRNEKSFDIHLALGFERMRGGKTESGASVDWYTEGAESKEALINKLTTMSRIESGRATRDQNTQSTTTSLARIRSSLNRAFVWRSTDDLFTSYAKDAPGGAMSFIEYEGGKIGGHLYVETDYAAGGPLKSQMDAVIVQGTVETLPDGSKRIEFRPLRGSLSGTDFTSTATLSKDGSSLQGDTSVIFNYNGDVRRFSYSWTAR